MAAIEPFKPTFSGIIEESGVVSVGKTAFSLEAGARLERYAYLNLDVKKPIVASELGLYRHFMDIRAPMPTAKDQRTELEMCVAVLETLHNIKKGQFDVLVLDAYENFYQSLKALVSARADGLQKVWSNKLEYRGMQKQALPNKVLQPGILSYVQSKVPLTIIITHLTDEYSRKHGTGESVKTGRQIPNVTQSMIQKVCLRLWLVPNPNHQMPNALVLKNMGKTQWVPGKGVQSPTVFPLKLDQRILPDWEKRDYISLWDVIRAYWDKPIGNRDPHDFEIPTEEESRMITGILSESEERTLEYNQKLALVSANPEQTDRILELHAEGMKILDIRKSLNGEGLGRPSIQRIKKIIEIANGE